MAFEPGKIGPNGKPMRQREVAPGLLPWLINYRHLILRRLSQFGILLLFFGSAHWAWHYQEKLILSGNLSSSLFLDTIPMADPFAVLQIFLTGHLLEQEVVLGAALILGFYWLVGGRVWCSWVCPLNPVTDLAGWLRDRLGVSNAFHLPRQTRYVVLAVSLVLSLLIGVAAFEWVSPIAILHREILYGIGAGWLFILGIFVFDLLLLKHGWCGRLCPLGAFYALVNRYSPLKLRFKSPTCTHCGECIRVCPEPQVLNLHRAGEIGLIDSGECTNCGRCISVCAEDTLVFDWRPLINNKTHHLENNQRSKSL